MLYIGIDLGTSAVKLLLMDATGDIKKIVSKEYPIFFPQTGWSEQNPEDWYNATIAGLKELTAECDTTLINGLSFSGQMHGLVILDKDDQVIRPAILWNDGRTQKECDYLNNEIGRAQLSQYTANVALTGFTAPKILWVKNNEPENFSRIEKIMLPKDYLAYRLTGNHCTDVSDASGMLLLDVKNKCWSKDMISILGLNEKQLAEIHESADVIGTVKESVATELNFPSTVNVIIGGGDQAVAAVGTGTVGDGMCNISLGTSGVVFIASKNFAVDDNNAMHAFAHADGKYHLMGVTLSAAASNKWWMDEVIGTKDYAAEQKDITTLGENNIFFLPYLMGERTPHNNPDARGTFIGMTMNTTRADMTQAVLEGVAYSLRDCLEIARSLGVKIERTRINGGGAKSPLWKKIIANVMNVTVDTINSEEGPAFGAAILACVGCKEYATVEEAASKLIQVIDSVEPDTELVNAYEKQYKKFVTIYPALKDVFGVIK
ncbi:xylulokinase [Anaerosporobacter sp.]|uniref:xylulokinase n=1 Tax=Anaerosporobacter sp. TaxID=1872529 RepID=UPI00286F430F|nr:xylulokinase [Anaerosporobacter sp.]